MPDEHDIPVKVVDRRWWARSEDGEAAVDRSDKPTFVEDLERKLVESEKRGQEYLAKYREASQEFENVRARMRRDLAKDAERTRRDVLISLLEVVDNLDRAIDAAKKSPRPDAGQGSGQAGTKAADPLLQGVEMVQQQFLAKLDGFGVKRIDAQGARFDPVLHEAVTTVPDPDPSADGRVVGVITHGYRIGDEVLRPALVAVARSDASTPGRPGETVASGATSPASPTSKGSVQGD
jgi:molecular chaperone GrpE